MKIFTDAGNVGRRAALESPDDAPSVTEPRGTEPGPPASGKSLPPAAERALAEAAERRAAIDARAAELAKVKEHRGRGGLEPVRYQDWEVKGLASDF